MKYSCDRQMCWRFEHEGLYSEISLFRTEPGHIARTETYSGLKNRGYGEESLHVYIWIDVLKCSVGQISGITGSEKTVNWNVWMRSSQYYTKHNMQKHLCFIGNIFYRRIHMVRLINNNNVASKTIARARVRVWMNTRLRQSIHSLF